MDCKATVKLGELSRGGMTRGDNRACDHDMEYHGKHTPCGILDEDTGQLHIEFGSSAKTSDFLVDSLQAWWNQLPTQEQRATTQIQIKMDNGPESSGVRTLRYPLKLRRGQLIGGAERRGLSQPIARHL